VAEKTTWTKEEMIAALNENITRDRMISFLTAAVQWGAATGMAPQILAEGRRMLERVSNPPQEPVQPPGEKGENE
jgi:hypothetical protein